MSNPSTSLPRKRDRAALAQILVRDRLAELVLVRLRKAVNPGHGQITVVEAAASRFELRAEF